MTATSKSRKAGSPCSAKIRSMDWPARHDLDVGVRPVPVEPFGQEFGKRRLAGGAVANEGQEHKKGLGIGD